MRVVARVLSVTIVATVLGSLLAAAAAHADPLAKPASAAARNHLTHGNRLYGVRSFDEAVVEYKAGALIDPAPVFDYNLGQCFRQLGKYHEAIWHYERFLARGNPEGELLDAVKGFIVQMKSELDRKAMIQKPTEPGPSRVTEPPPGRLPGEQLTDQRSEAWYEDRFSWGLVGAGVVGLAVGGGLLINATSLNNDANSNPNQQERDRLRDQASTRKLFGAVVGVTGVGLLATGIIKLAVHAKGSRVTAWSLTPSSNGVLVLGTF